MAFVISNKSSYTWPVKYQEAENGRFVEKDFTAEFARVPQSKLDEFQRQAKDGSLDDEALISAVLIGWSGIKASDGTEFGVSDIHRAILLDLPGMRAAIVGAFAASIMGAPRKN